MTIQIQEEDFDVATLYQGLANGNQQTGAIAIFTGLVRDINLDEKIQTLFLEHYPGMTESTLESIAQQACQRFGLHDIHIVHRVGQLKPNDNIVFVGCAAAHRDQAFAACQYTMDWLKTEAPFWKQETTPSGAKWLDARESDFNARNRWENNEH